MILKFKEFITENYDEKTILKNNKEYNKYAKKAKTKDGIHRAGMVAWTAEDSQIKNFRYVEKYVKQGDSVLDFGCGIGDFYNHIKDKISSYKGVDINPDFIKTAKESYDTEFELITDPEQITGNYDLVCAIGVFTWFITKNDFIKTINHLHKICNREVVLTLLYKFDTVQFDNNFWKSTYRYYNEYVFDELFPNLNIQCEVTKNDDLIVRIIK
jgi:cyclopropane fatty-acyl-phospholipid synthase-like methyltransferase